MEFKHNKETGILEVWDKGKKIGEVITMGDAILENDLETPKEEPHITALF